MSKSVNKVILLGNIGKSPEIHSTGAGSIVAKFSIALAERFKDKDGNWQDKTEWVNCVCFGRTSEIVRDYVGKGSKLYVEGKLQTRSWEDKETGKTRYSTEVVVFDVSLLDSKSSESKKTETNDDFGGGNNDEITDEDIPF